MQVTRLVRGGVLFTALMDLDGIDNRQKKEGRGQADPNQEETAAADTTNEKTTSTNFLRTTTQVVSTRVRGRSIALPQFHPYPWKGYSLVELLVVI